MKVIFLDIDGVLNNQETLLRNDELDNILLLRLKTLVDKTGAKIVLSSSWRTCFNPLRILMDRFNEIGLFISSLTPNGVSVDWIEKQGYIPTARYFFTKNNIDGNRHYITTDRGAEIFKWLSTHQDIESYVILDDEAFDILNYFPNNFIKTNSLIGLTEENIQQAEKILTKTTR